MTDKTPDWKKRYSDPIREMDQDTPKGRNRFYEDNALATWKSSRPKMMERIETQDKLLDQAWDLIAQLSWDHQNQCVLCDCIEGDEHKAECPIRDFGLNYWGMKGRLDG